VGEAVQWISYVGLILEPSEIEDYVVNLAAYDAAAGDLPPQAFGEQKWRTDVAYQGLTVVKGRCLHPDRLVTLFDNDNSLFDTYELKCKPKKKEKGYAASSRGDTSGRDFKLAMGAVKAGFDNQEIADLLIGCRAHNNNDFKRRDYYLRTIWGARERVRIDRDPLEQEHHADRDQQQGQQQQRGERSDEEILNSIPRDVRDDVAGKETDEHLANKVRAIGGIIGFFIDIQAGAERTVTLLTKVESDPSSYEFYIDDGKRVTVEGEASLFNAEAVRDAFCKGNYLLPQHTPADWRGIARRAFRAAIPVSAAIGTTKHNQLEEFASKYCYEKRYVSRKEDLAAAEGAPLLKHGNQIWIPVHEFLRWAKARNVEWTLREFAQFSVPLGYKRERVQSKRGVLITMFMVPEGVIDIEGMIDAHNLRSERKEERLHVN